MTLLPNYPKKRNQVSPTKTYHLIVLCNVFFFVIIELFFFCCLSQWLLWPYTYDQNETKINEKKSLTHEDKKKSYYKYGTKSTKSKREDDYVTHAHDHRQEPF